MTHCRCLRYLFKSCFKKQNRSFVIHFLSQDGLLQAMWYIIIFLLIQNLQRLCQPTLNTNTI